MIFSGKPNIYPVEYAVHSSGVANNAFYCFCAFLRLITYSPFHELPEQPLE